METRFKLFNTLKRAIEDFKPLAPGKVKIYCCGPTVYDYQHIGNLRTYIFEDLLVRTLKRLGYDVLHVMNITDVGHLVSDADEGEDKMLLASRREKKSSLEIADYYTKIFFDDCQRLNIEKPNIICKATDHIAEMIELIKRLETNGLTYLAGGNVYLDVSKISDYGKLANLDLKALKAGARIEVDPNKRNPFDFVLWFTKSKFENQELQWDSPWGRGYPGWHIECSAMSMKYLGEAFDIHCGGIDHIPVHHTNEIAQSEGATGKPWVNYWLHGEFLVLNKEKMSKSKGGFLTLKSVIDEGIDPLAYRYMCLTAHYRTQLSFSWESLESAANSLEKLRQAIVEAKNLSDQSKITEEILSDFGQKAQEEFDLALSNDLNLPQALAVLWGVINQKSISPTERLTLFRGFDEILGLGLDAFVPQTLEVPLEVTQLVSQRELARQQKNWPEADRLRQAIISLGFTVLDSPTGQKIEKL